MPAHPIRCPGCGARLKAPEGKAKLRCPVCKAVFPVRPAIKAPEEETLDRLEEVDEAPASIRRLEDDRPRRRRGRHGQPRWADSIWLGALGLSVVTFFISLGVTLLAYGFQGLPENDQGGGVLFKIAVLVIGVLGGLGLTAGGVYCAKTQTIYDRWGRAMKGPFAAILAAVVAITGSVLSGFTLYGLLLALAQGR